MKKLNARGIAHDVLIVGFVVTFAIAGVGYIVASHADTCPPVSGAVSGATSAAASGAVSSTNCQPVSAPTSSPVSVATTLAGTCVLSGVPVSPANGTVIGPGVTFTNTGTKAFTPNAVGNISTVADSGSTGNKGGPATATSSLLPGKSVTISTGLQYTVTYSSASSRKVVFTVTSTSPGFSCAGTSTLPTAPVVSVVLAARCSIAGLPALPKFGQVLRPYAAITNTGNQAFSPRFVSNLIAYNSSNKITSDKQSTLSAALTKPGLTTNVNLAAYTVPHKSSNITKATYSVASTVKNIPFSCSSSFKLP